MVTNFLDSNHPVLNSIQDGDHLLKAKLKMATTLSDGGSFPDSRVHLVFLIYKCLPMSEVELKKSNYLHHPRR